MSSKTDKNGKRLGRNQIAKPKWPPPYKTPIELAGFRLLDYLGYRRYGDDNKGAHWYVVQCLECSKNYERYQGSLVRAVSLGSHGCQACSRKRHDREQAESTKRERERIERESRLLAWANNLMPVTSLRLRDEIGRSFDSENAKVLGWRTI